jgi:hypothetical protein
MNVYGALAQHQAREAWFAHDLIETLQAWAERFSAEFKLDIPRWSCAPRPCRSPGSAASAAATTVSA